MTVLLVRKMLSCVWCFRLQEQGLELVRAGTHVAKAAVVVTVMMFARASKTAALTTTNTVRLQMNILTE